ncbi:TPA: hypothetical protein U2M59_003038 [Providencia stuartii]|nr:hypothetical protein [Providencia stuartii]
MKLSLLVRFSIFFLIFLFIFIFCILIFIDENDKTKIACESKFNVTLDSGNSGYFYFMFTSNENKAWVNIQGEVQGKESKKLIISRQVYFDLFKIKDNFKIRTKKIIVSDKDLISDEEFIKFLPAPLTFKDLEMNIFIFPQGYNNGYVFATNEVYAFYCN